jgi:hypothetical protein
VNFQERKEAREMAKSDGLFARIDVDIWFSKKVSKIRPAGAICFYFLVWMLAVRERTPNLLRSFVFHWAKIGIGLSKVTIRRYERICVDAGVISIFNEDTIIVHKVKESHAKIAWREDEIQGHMADAGGDIQGAPGGTNEIVSPPYPPHIPPNENENEKRTDKKRYDERYIKREDNISEIGGIIDSMSFVDEKIEENEIDSYVDELMTGLKLRPAERGAIKRLVRKYPKKAMNEALSTVRDSMDDDCVRGTKKVENPIALFQYILKAQTK